MGEINRIMWYSYPKKYLIYGGWFGEMTSLYWAAKCSQLHSTESEIVRRIRVRRSNTYI